MVIAQHYYDYGVCVRYFTSQDSAADFIEQLISEDNNGQDQSI